VPRVLGIVLAVDALVWTGVSATVLDVGAPGWGALVGSLLVFAAGLVDDLAQAGPRGLRAHLRSLVAGRVTTGIVKLIVIAGSAVVVVTLQPGRSGYAAVCGVVVLAACANVWNGLDVVPGRALKAFLLPAFAFVPWGEISNAPLIVGLLAGAVVVLPFDLRELAMLGDGGANLIGFCAGLALYDVLPDPWVAVAAAAAVALNVIADTVSFSRLIERTAPLRWLDGLGRRT
jgi:UDP-GlcNAc:undecaprenyl-phosphate/decaprenyl-phosphate GlcNAc-1-phosphate transferase